MHRVHAVDVNSDSVQLSPGEAHHVSRVLRLRPGDSVIVFDGRGHEWLARIASSTISDDGCHVTLDVIEPRSSIAEPAVAVTLGVGLLKGDQIDTIVRDTTALGVSIIAPFTSEHVALPRQARESRSTERWERIAVAAAKQCGRSSVPEVRPVRSLADVLTDAGGTLLAVCVEPGRTGFGEALPSAPPPRVTLLVGPEGGWSRDEIDVMQRRGAVGLNLGPRTLRAELAPAVALSVLWTTWGWK